MGNVDRAGIVVRKRPVRAAELILVRHESPVLRRRGQRTIDSPQDELQQGNDVKIIDLLAPVRVDRQVLVRVATGARPGP